MTTEYNARIDLAASFTAADADTIDAILDRLAGFSPALGGNTRHTTLDFTYPAEDLRTAVRTALALAGDAVGGLRMTGLEVITTAEFDRRAGLELLPPLVSVTEAAELLGVTRQAVLQRLESGSLPGTKVGNAWVVLRAAVEHAAG
jgi:excisionase family DNA binding protein